MKVKVGIIGKIEIRMQVSKMVYTVILIVLLLFFWEHFNDLFCVHLCTSALAFYNWFLMYMNSVVGCHSVFIFMGSLAGVCAAGGGRGGPL